MRDERIWIAAVAVLLLALIGLWIWAASAEAKQWAAFSAEHHCKKVGEMSSSSTTAVGIGIQGNLTVTPIFLPGKEAFQCDDGVTYWRNR